MDWTNDPTDDWASRGACRAGDPDALFVQGAAQNRAKAICSGCPVRTECLADSLDHRVEFGVWGGMTERERRALLRRRPNVASWRHLLETARSDHALTNNPAPVTPPVTAPVSAAVSAVVPATPNESFGTYLPYAS